MSALPLWAYPLILLASVALSMVFTPLALRVALRHGILDHPGPAKAHTEAVPYLGGAAIALAFSVAVLGAAVVHPPSRGLGQLAVIMALGLMLAALGLLDDLRGTPIWLRIALEAGAGAALWAMGVSVHLAGFPRGADAAATIAFVVIVTNAFNLLDNMDGLSAGVAAITLLGIFGVAAYHGEFLVAALAVALAGCAAGFLRHNFHPASIYMGDAGSLFLGFLIAMLALKLRDSPDTRVDMAVLVAVLWVALLDTGLVTMTRILHKVSPFKGGQDHTSHRLVQLGFSVRSAVVLIYAVASLMAGLGVLISASRPAANASALASELGVGVVVVALLAVFTRPEYGSQTESTSK
ncbi:MAG: glycosyltransferase family 4 protein [Acidimicrobiales bacterium]